MDNQDFIQLPTELLQLVSPEEANHFRIVPKAKEMGLLEFFIDETTLTPSMEVEEELSLVFNQAIKLHPIQTAIINKTLSRYYRSPDTHDVNYIRNDYVETLIFEAKKIDASDIHIEIYNNDARVRLRINGNLVETSKIEKSDYPELINQIKIKAKLNITERRLPQDGRLEFEDFDVRVSILPTHYGETVVMRILGKDASHLELASLGFDRDELEVYTENIEKPNGIILISGPTGSGKTTTLYATLKSLNGLEKKIVTVEDPIEYTLKGINQVQLREDIGLDFTTALKSFLRQDPDIIMLGEIRDAKTAQMAVRASLTGHLVLSTIHTNSAAGTISRLRDMGVPSFLISETLNISLAQRLVRILCSHCKVEEPFRPEELPASFQLKNPEEFPHSCYSAKGCENCYYTGYVGRKAIYEILPVTNEIATDIRNERDLDATTHRKRLADKAFELLKQGSTSIAEVYPLLLNI